MHNEPKLLMTFVLSNDFSRMLCCGMLRNNFKLPRGFCEVALLIKHALRGEEF